MTEYPSGTITFLMTDIENSTELWERSPEAMLPVLARHDEIIEATVLANHGLVVRPRGEGDSRFAVFPQAGDGVRAALEIQHGLDSGFADLPLGLKVRIGMHTGAADLRMGDYYGSTVNRCARIRSLGHGGQALLSQVTAELVRDSLPPDVVLIDMGTHHLKGLSRGEKVYQLGIPGLPDQFPPLKSTDGIHTNLPIPPTPFIGRQDEVADVAGLLEREGVRLVTLTGPGGTGKTRLSLEVGEALLEHFTDGVFFVDLAPISDPALAATTIAHTLGIREGGGRPPVENLKDYLADKAMLLIFDNFEQIISAARVVAELLAADAKIKILATSRIALQLRGEHEVPVLPMTIPQAGAPLSLEQTQKYPVVQLFMQQAQAAMPGFELTGENAAVILEICRRLDGLPLAIEIAAARVKLLPPQAILKRLDQRLRLLVGGAVDLPTRHQTLRGTVDWSYNLLNPEEQSLFARLSVFVGGFTLESAESVCSPDGDLDVFSGVEALFNNNLLRRVESVSGEARFDMLQTIREYATEKLESLGGLAQLRRAHAAHYGVKAAEEGLMIIGRQTVASLARTAEEHDNFRAALTWSLEAGNDLSLAVNICLQLLWFWYRYGHFHEGRAWCERVLAAAQSRGDSALLSKALYIVGSMAMWEADLDIAAQRFEQAQRIEETSEDDTLLAFIHLGYGGVLINQGRDREAYSHLTQAAELYDQSGMPWFLVQSLVHISNVALGLGDYPLALARLDQSMPMVKEIGDPWQLAFCLNNYGEVARAQGDYETAKAYYLRTEASFLEADALGDHARLVHTLGYLAQHEGDDEKAWTLFRESLAKFRMLGNRRGIAECLAGLASVAAEQKHDRWAATLLGAAHAVLTRFGGAWWPADRVEVEHTLERLKSSLDTDTFNRLWREGQAMSMEDAMSYAAGQISA